MYDACIFVLWHFFYDSSDSSDFSYDFIFFSRNMIILIRISLCLFSCIPVVLWFMFFNIFHLCCPNTTALYIVSVEVEILLIVLVVFLFVFLSVFSSIFLCIVSCLFISLVIILWECLWKGWCMISLLFVILLIVLYFKGTVLFSLDWYQL